MNNGSETEASSKTLPVNGKNPSEPLRLFINRRVPSLNRLLYANAMTVFREKRRIQDAFVSSLSAMCADNSVTKTTFVQNSLSTAYATLASYVTTARESSNSKSKRRGFLRGRKKAAKS